MTLYPLTNRTDVMITSDNLVSYLRDACSIANRQNKRSANILLLELLKKACEINQVLNEIKGEL